MISKRSKTNSIFVVPTYTPNAKPMRDWDIEVLYRDEGVNGLGCHYIVHINGDVSRGRDHAVYANHDEQIDKDSVVIVVVGTHQFNEAQDAAVAALVSWLKEIYLTAEEVNLLEA